MAQLPAMIHYEYPLNERVRMLLRLEDLFDRYGGYIAGTSGLMHHAALHTLFEIAEIAGRTDLKSDLLQELERQRTLLAGLMGNPGVETAALRKVLEDIDGARSGIHAISGRVGQHLKDDDWLNVIRQRAIIPGGLCEFDVPSYHHWLHRPPEERRGHLVAWVEPMAPVRISIGIVLRLLREGSRPQQQHSSNGSFQQMLEGRVVHMLRIGLEDGLPCVPEISANKYMLNIRFVSAGPGQPKICAEGVDFELTFCTF